MSARASILLVVALLAGCARPAAVPTVDETVAGVPDSLPVTTPTVVEKAAVADQPLPEAVEAVSESVAGPILAAQAVLADLSPVLPPPEARDVACRRAAASLIIRWEVTSPRFYALRLQRPVWPGGASGVTWGIGYDGGHQTGAVIADDWLDHYAAARLSTSAGLTGARAKAVMPQYRDIETGYEHAARVFEERSLVEYERRTRRAFGNERFDELRPTACGALVSLVYNRGGAMTGDNRREMRAIRDDCVPKQDYACIAGQLRSMKRLWRGTINENGLGARREAEAQVAESN